MRFDAERAMALAGRLDFPRIAGTAGERRAADLVAEEFQRAGLRVERLTSPERPGKSWSLVLIGLALVPVWERFGVLSSVGLLASTLGTILLPLMAWQSRSRIGSRSRARSRVSGIIQVDRAVESPTMRVIFRSRLDTPTPRRVLRWRWLIVALSLACLGVLVGLATPGSVAPPIWALGLFGGIWVLVLLLLVEPWDRERPPTPGDNRTGLALLVELARIWPKESPGRVEARFVALGCQGSVLEDRAEVRALAGRIGRDGPPAPTRIVNLRSPGLGSRVELVGAGDGLRLAAGAADDLWIPYRVACRRSLFGRAAAASVTVRGDQRAGRIDTAAFAATAQLLIEIALRWARRSS